MRDPVVDEQRDTRIGEEVLGLEGARVGGHDDGGARVPVIREEGVVHQGDVRSRRSGMRGGDGGEMQEAGVFETLRDFWWEGG